MVIGGDDPVLAGGREIVAAASRANALLRLFGSVAVRFRCALIYESAPELAQSPRDIDLVGLASESSAIETVLRRAGARPLKDFNVLNAGRQMRFAMDASHGGCTVDVILDKLCMCHTILLARRLSSHPLTISASDLLLSKLQVVEIGERDINDALAILLCFALGKATDNDRTLDVDYLGKLLGKSWGLHHTVSINLERLRIGSSRLANAEARHTATERIGSLCQLLARCRKTVWWRGRALIGERVQWYELPEEVAEDVPSANTITR